MINTIILFIINYAFIGAPLIALFIILILLYAVIRASAENKENIAETMRKEKEQKDKERENIKEFLEKNDKIIDEIMRKKQ